MNNWLINSIKGMWQKKIPVSKIYDKNKRTMRHFPIPADADFRPTHFRLELDIIQEDVLELFMHSE